MSTSTDEYINLTLGLPPRRNAMWVVGAVVKSRPCTQNIDTNVVVHRTGHYLFRRDLSDIFVVLEFPLRDIAVLSEATLPSEG